MIEKAASGFFTISKCFRLELCVECLSPCLWLDVLYTVLNSSQNSSYKAEMQTPLKS